jgi:DNA-binding phage protein
VDASGEIWTRYERIAVELVRALRGRRSRPAFSRVLGYRSNVVQRWELRVSWPTASSFFEVCERLRIDTRAAVSRFLRREPSWLAQRGVCHPAGVAALLTDLKGRTPVGVIAERSGYNRFSVSRWLKGTAQPRLPEFLAVLDACSRRVPDFVAELVDPAQLPTLADEWRRLTLAREGVHSQPWSHAVLRALELPWSGGRRQQVAFLAQKTGLSVAAVEAELNFLVTTDQAALTRQGYHPRPAANVDTGGQAARGLTLKLSWARHALDRLGKGGPGHLGYSLFSVSHKDLKRIWQLQLDYVRAVSSIIAASEPGECVGLYTAALLDLDAGPDNVFTAHEVPPAAVSARRARTP